VGRPEVTGGPAAGPARSLVGEIATVRALTRGFRTVPVTEAAHTYVDRRRPLGHILGWEHTFVHQAAHLTDAIVNDGPVEPYQATFVDGYRAAAVADARLEPAQAGPQVTVIYDG
jgi:hypothetical protein